MSKLSLVVVNFAVLCVLLVVVNVGAYVASLLLPASVPQPNPPGYAPPYKYPSMVSYPWARTHFAEVNQLKVLYRSFVGWRRSPFRGETITIDARGIRQSSDDPRRDVPVVGIFGGSTVWGTGSTDAGTISSALNRQGGGRYRTVNYGETGFRAVQGFLTLFGEYQAAQKFSHVIFYDGVNDVYTGCRSDIAPYAHYFDRQYRDIIDYFRDASAQYKVLWEQGGGGSDVVPSIATLFQPVVDLLNRLAGRPANSILKSDRISSILDNNVSFECDQNPHRADAAAEMLVRSWVEAAALAKRNGAEVFAFLQPVAYFTKSNADYLELDRDPNSRVRLKAQFEAVYPRIRRLAAAAAAQYGFKFVDLSSALDQPGVAYYIDFCHVSPNGNEVLARAIADVAIRDGR